MLVIYVHYLLSLFPGIELNLKIVPENLISFLQEHLFSSSSAFWVLSSHFLCALHVDVGHFSYYFVCGFRMRIIIYSNFSVDGPFMSVRC